MSALVRVLEFRVGSSTKPPTLHLRTLTTVLIHYQLRAAYRTTQVVIRYNKFRAGF